MKTVVLDVETIADRSAMERCGYEEDEGVFSPWPLHQLACASVLSVRSAAYTDIAFDLRSFSRRSMGERGIVASVERAIEGADQILTFNGKAFDIPVLLARAIVAEEFVPTLARLGHRCRPGIHRDLHEELKGSGGSIKLVHLCAAFAIPAKVGGAGDHVAKLARGGRWLDIEHYCETDVVATWLAAQMWESSECPGFGRERWEALARWLEAMPPGNPRLREYLDVPLQGATPAMVEATC